MYIWCWSTEASFVAIKICQFYGDLILTIDRQLIKYYQGVKIFGNKPQMQSEAWEIYSDLITISAAQDGGLYPFAATASRESGGLSTPSYSLFVLERPKCQAINRMVGNAALALNLRRYPDIIRLWASQFGKVYNCLCRNQAGSLLDVSPSLDSMYVRDVSIGC